MIDLIRACKRVWTSRTATAWSWISLARLGLPCFAAAVAKEKTTSPRKDSDRKAEARKIGEFVGRLIEEGNAKSFLVQHGFVTPSGRLTKRYGG